MGFRQRKPDFDAWAFSLEQVKKSKSRECSRSGYLSQTLLLFFCFLASRSACRLRSASSLSFRSCTSLTLNNSLTLPTNTRTTLPIIFRILYGCGLRVSEVVGLRCKDVNLEEGILTIREAKTDRDRYIPLSDSVKEACISYSDKTWWEKDSDFFFPTPDKTMISPMTIYQRYRRYLEVAGISHGGKGQGPRLHDIRHTFAVHVLQKWIKEEADLTAMLPILSTYMGTKQCGQQPDICA